MEEELIISIRTFQDEETGKFGVELILSGLESQKHAEAAVAFMQKQLCGTQKTVN